jgi:hypothetical protein
MGCCDSNGECVAGTALFVCGAGGAACVKCEANQACQAGACGVIDGGVRGDAGVFDAGRPDASVDAGRPDAGPVDAGPVSFSSDIAPVLDNVCVPCHTWSYSSIVNMTGSCGVLVKPGTPSGSAIYTKVAGSPSCGAPMPLNQAPLSQPTIDAIGRWISQGAPNN